MGVDNLELLQSRRQSTQIVEAAPAGTTGAKDALDQFRLGGLSQKRRIVGAGYVAPADGGLPQHLDPFKLVAILLSIVEFGADDWPLGVTNFVGQPPATLLRGLDQRTHHPQVFGSASMIAGTLPETA